MTAFPDTTMTVTWSGNTSYHITGSSFPYSTPTSTTFPVITITGPRVSREQIESMRIAEEFAVAVARMEVLREMRLLGQDFSPTPERTPVLDSRPNERRWMVHRLRNFSRRSA